MRDAFLKRLMVPASLIKESLSIIAWAFTSFEPSRAASKPFVLEVSQVSLGQVVGHPGLISDAAFFALKDILDKIRNDSDLVHAAHGGIAQHMVFVQPGFVDDPGCVNNKGEDRR